MSATYDALLAAAIDQAMQPLQARLAEVTGDTTFTGYTARIFAARVMVLVETQEKLAELDAIATANTQPSSLPRQRVATFQKDVAGALRQSSFMASFMVLYEEFQRYANAMKPGAATDDALRAFEDRCNDFASRTSRLEAQESAFRQDWLAPLSQAIQKKRADIAQQMQPPPDAAHLTAAFNDACSALDNALKPLNTQIAASNGNIWADRTPLYRASDLEYQKALASVSGLEAPAKALADAGDPALSTAIAAWKADTQKASATLKQIAGDRNSSDADVQKDPAYPS